MLKGENRLRKKSDFDAVLRGDAEEKLPLYAAVAAKQRHYPRAPAHFTLPAQGVQVPLQLPPRRADALCGADSAQIVHAAKRSVRPSKPSQHHGQPAGNQVRGQQTVRIHSQRSPAEALPPGLPAAQPQHQNTQYRSDAVLVIGDQLDRQQREGTLQLAAQKTCNRDSPLVKDRKQLNGVPPVGRDLPIATTTPTKRAFRTQVGRKINPTALKPFSVFPKALEAVKVGKLYFSAPRSQGGGF